MLSNEEIDELFEEFLEAPELEQWQSHLISEYEDAKAYFRRAVQKAIKMHGDSPEQPDTPDMGSNEPG